MPAPDSKIRSAFVTRLNLFPSLPSLAEENVLFTPVIGTPYLKTFLVTGEPNQDGIGESSQNKHSGFFQISIYYPSNVGVFELNELRDALLNHFKRGLILTYETVNLTVTKSFATTAIPETDWIHLPITIPYRLLADN